MAWHERRDSGQETTRAAVVECRQTEVEVGLVVGPRARPALSLRQPALRGPIDDLAVAELDVLRVLLQEVVKPIERALVRDAHRKHDLVLPVHGGGRLKLLDVRHRRALGHAALERQRPHGCRSEVDLQRHVPEADVREEGLALERLRKRLRLRSALAVHEEADSVAVRALGVQIHEYRGNGLAAEALASVGRALPLGEVPALRIEVHAAVTVAEEERGPRGRETCPHDLPGRGPALPIRMVAPAVGLAGQHGLDDLNLVHVPPSLEAGVRAGPSDKVLHAAVG
mmetsp:Transcript_121530/g.343820  ORF Transcript_121530/g.343820 Transcript_121530/m.343820 type:complete len:284 (+) Transcript_121530:1461-2312(+)